MMRMLRRKQRKGNKNEYFGILCKWSRNEFDGKNDLREGRKEVGSERR